MKEKNSCNVAWNFGDCARGFHFATAFCDPMFSSTIEDTEPKAFHYHQGGHWHHSCGQFDEEGHTKKNFSRFYSYCSKRRGNLALTSNTPLKNKKNNHSEPQQHPEPTTRSTINMLLVLILTWKLLGCWAIITMSDHLTLEFCSTMEATWRLVQVYATQTKIHLHLQGWQAWSVLYTSNGIATIPTTTTINQWSSARNNRLF